MADKINLIIDQGSTYSVDFNVYQNDNLVDLTTYTSNGSIKKYYSSNTYYDITTETYANGTVRCSLTANQTSAIPEGRYVYDVKIKDSFNVVTRIVEGVITITPHVTESV